MEFTANCYFKFMFVKKNILKFALLFFKTSLSFSTLIHIFFVRDIRNFIISQIYYYTNDFLEN